ncbi:hypothetical protein Dimus_039199 [Dionaea muscipula]
MDPPVQSPTPLVDHSIAVEEPLSMIEETPQQPQGEEPLRRSTRERRRVISNDYVVYLQEHEFDIRLEDDPSSVNQVKLSPNSSKWIDAMNEEMKSMHDNDV